MSESRTKKIIHNSSFAILKRVVSIITGFITKTIFIRTLGLQYVGVSGLFTDILIMLSLAELGIGSAITYSLYKPLKEDDFLNIAKLMHFFKLSYRIIAIVIVCVGIILIPVLPFIVNEVPDIQEGVQLIFILYVINSATSYLFIYKSILLIADQKGYIVSNYQIIFSLVKVLFQCIMLLVYKNFIGYLITEIIVTFIQNYFISRRANKEYLELERYKNEKLDKKEQKKLFADVRAVFTYKVSTVVLSGTDSTVISTLINTGSVGLVGNYKAIRGYVSSIIAQVFNAMNPTIGNLVADNESNKYKVFNELLFFTFWVSSLTTVIFYFLLNPFIELWIGRTYLLSEVFVGVFVFEYYVSTMLGPIGSFRLGSGLFIQTKYVTLLMSVINLVVSILLVKRYGVIGVILGTVISRLLTQAWYEPYVVYKEVFDKSVKIYYRKYLSYISSTFLSIAIVKVISVNFLNIENSFFKLIVLIILSIVVNSLVIIIRYSRSDEYQNVKLRFLRLLNTNHLRRNR